MDLDGALRSLDASDQIIKDALEAVVLEVRAQGARLDGVANQLAADRATADGKFAQMMTQFSGVVSSIQSDVQDIKTAAAAAVPVPSPSHPSGAASSSSRGEVHACCAFCTNSFTSVVGILSASLSLETFSLSSLTTSSSSSLVDANS